eukprot:EG_transcript_66661
MTTPRSRLPLHWVLRFLDRYCMQLQPKNGFTYRASRYIAFTSNFPPNRWFPHAWPEQLVALWNRLDEPKNGFTYRASRYIAFTSNFPPNRWFPHAWPEQ